MRSALRAAVARVLRALRGVLRALRGVLPRVLLPRVLRAAVGALRRAVVAGVQLAGAAVVGDALALPFADGAFDRLLTGHFSGHLPPDERERFLAEARRGAGELLVCEPARRPGVPAAGTDDRVLEDGSRHAVYKRWLTPAELEDELGAEVLLAGTWFVVARA